MIQLKTDRVRRLVKTALAQALSSRHADALIGRLADARTQPVVIGYHRVVEDFAAASALAIPAMLTSCRMLESHLDWLGQHYRLVSLDELGQALAEGRTSARPAAAVTFDDGYRDVYDHAFPILKRKGIPAAVFVVTDLIGTARAQVHDRLYLLARRAFERWPDPAEELRRLLSSVEIELPGLERLEPDRDDPLPLVVMLLRGLGRGDVERVAAAIQADVGPDGAEFDAMVSAFEPLGWDMLSEMARAGMVVGSHTRTHAWLTNESPAAVRAELRTSRGLIEQRLRVPVDHFAYPDGRFDATTVEAVSSAGYRFAYTTCTHRDPRFPLLSIPRRMLWERACVDAADRFSPAIMSCNVRGVWDLVTSCEQDHRP